MRKILIILLFGSFAFADYTSESLSFLDIPGSAYVGSLGNTMTSSVGRPESILQNPANIWVQNNYKVTISSRNHLGINDVKYSNIFFAFRRNIIVDFTFGLGYIYYGVSKVEQYDDYANFQKYFSLGQHAVKGAVSYKLMDITIGLGGLVAYNEWTSFEGNSYSGFDAGFSIVDPKIPFIGIKLNNLLLSGSVQKYFGNYSMYSKKNIGLSYSTNEILSIITLNLHSDLSNNDVSNKKIQRNGISIISKIFQESDFRVVLNIGNIWEPLYDQYKSISKFNLGMIIELPGESIKLPISSRISIGYSFEQDLISQIFDTHYFTLSIIGK
ncbi:MAG: hypothetical protein H8E71_04115 [Candidatus Marinimicrobia bacterium]|nr:hypothetical protein [Candidatus Neomarinimicrobiota bacterium]